MIENDLTGQQFGRLIVSGSVGRMRVLSLGAGVQSTTVFLLAVDGLLPSFDAAMFADTQEEPGAVYSHLWWLAQQAPWPTYIDTVGKLGDDLQRGRNTTGGRFAAIPAFTRAEFAGAEIGQTRRQCTKEYKTELIGRILRRSVLGLKPRQRIPNGTIVDEFFGISADEGRRAVSIKDIVERNPRLRARFPLLDMRWTRRDCIAYLAARVPHEVPRSACVFCPYKSDAEWQRLKDTDPAGWDRAVEVDVALRTTGSVANRDMRRSMYVHRSCKPLGEVEFHNGTGWLSFVQECQGMCGV